MVPCLDRIQRVKTSDAFLRVIIILWIRYKQPVDDLYLHIVPGCAHYTLRMRAGKLYIESERYCVQLK